MQAANRARAAIPNNIFLNIIMIYVYGFTIYYDFYSLMPAVARAAGFWAFDLLDNSVQAILCGTLDEQLDGVLTSRSREVRAILLKGIE